jgi:hypothetical protein
MTRRILRLPEIEQRGQIERQHSSLPGDHRTQPGELLITATVST